MRPNPVSTLEQARDKIKALGFNDQQRGTLIALLLAMPASDRFVLFDDVDAVVHATLTTLLRQNTPAPAPAIPVTPFDPTVNTFNPAANTFIFPAMNQNVAPRPMIPPQQQQQQQFPPFYHPQQVQFAPLAFAPVPQNFDHIVFHDDEPPVDLPPAYEAVATGAPGPGALTLRTKTLVPAVQFENAAKSLGMVTLKSPAMAGDNPKAAVALDLVAVLDISGSMSGAKLQLMKDAVQFVIRELSEKDRLCIVVFESGAEKLSPLTVMNEQGKNKLAGITDTIQTKGSTMIGSGLQLAIKTLQQRRHPNSVPSILLLSDGQDDRPDAVRAMEIPFVTHTFGFGADHDANLLGGIAQRTHGSFTFVEAFDVISEAFATCVGGLTSIFAQKIQIRVDMQGPYQFLKWHTRFTSAVAPDRKSATLSITDIYAEESRDMVFEVEVPKLPAAVAADPLFLVTCTYLSVGPHPEQITLPQLSQTLARPALLTGEMSARDFELDKQWNRIQTATAMEDAPNLCRDGKFKEAQELIKTTVALIQQSVSAADPTCKVLVSDLQACASRLVDRTSYESSGKAYAMQQQQQHWGQRATYSACSPSANMYSNVQAAQWASKAINTKKH